MNTKRTAIWSMKVIVLMVPALLTGIGFCSEPVRVSGSSTVYPIIRKAIGDYHKSRENEAVFAADFCGTTAGFRLLLEGTADMVGASRPILAEEIENFRAKGVRFFEFPVAFDALTVAVPKDNNWVDYLSVEELKKMWQPSAEGRVNKWSDVRKGWPEEPIFFVAPGRDSGTFDYFTEVINGEKGASRSDVFTSENDQVLADALAGNKYAIGYFGHACAEENKHKLRPVPILLDRHPKTGEALRSKPVEPTLQNVLRGAYIPLGRPLFFYARDDSIERKPALRSFLDWFFSENRGTVRRAGYLPLNEIAYRQNLQRMRDRTTGSAFSGQVHQANSLLDILDFDPREN